MTTYSSLHDELEQRKKNGPLDVHPPSAMERELPPCRRYKWSEMRLLRLADESQEGEYSSGEEHGAKCGGEIEKEGRASSFFWSTSSVKLLSYI